MHCPSCGVESAEDKRFCSDCGNLLFTPTWPLAPYLDSRVKQIIASEFKDQTLLTKESADKAIEVFHHRLVTFAKWVGFPLAILSASFTVWQIKSLSDARQKLDDLISPVQTKMNTLSSLADTQSLRIEQFKVQMDQAKGNLGSFSDRLQALEALRHRLETSARTLHKELNEVKTEIEDAGKQLPKDH